MPPLLAVLQAPDEEETEELLQGEHLLREEVASTDAVPRRWRWATLATALAAGAGLAVVAASSRSMTRVSTASVVGLDAVPSYLGLLSAAEVGDVQAVREILAGGVDPNTCLPPPDGCSQALVAAVTRNDLELASVLLDAGANPNGVRTVSDTFFQSSESPKSCEEPVLSMTVDGCFKEMYDLLVSKGADQEKGRVCEGKLLVAIKDDWALMCG